MPGQEVEQSFLYLGSIEKQEGHDLKGPRNVLMYASQSFHFALRECAYTHNVTLSVILIDSAYLYFVYEFWRENEAGNIST